MPSRKVISVLIIAIGLVTGILLISRPESSILKSKTTLVSGSLVSGPEIKTNSTWQADLENLRPVSADLSNPSTESDSVNNETLTDQLSRSLFANYFSMKQSGSLDSSSAADLVDQAAKFVDQPTKTQYTLKDILVSSDNSKLAITKYGNDLGLAFKKNKPTGEIKNEINLFKEILQSKNKTGAQDLKNIATIYENMAFSLSKITVPSSFIEAHLTLTNNLANLAVSVSDMAEALIDPVKSLRALSTYTENTANIANTKKTIQDKILNSQVVYKQGENGYYFYFGI